MEPDVRDLQAVVRNAIRSIPDPSERKAAEEALDGILCHYQDACQKIGEMISEKGRTGDFHIVTQYSGDASRVREAVDGDAAHMRILVGDAEGNTREVYCGVEYSEKAATLPDTPPTPRRPPLPPDHHLWRGLD